MRNYARVNGVSFRRYLGLCLLNYVAKNGHLGRVEFAARGYRNALLPR